MLVKASEQKVFEEGESVTVLFAGIKLKGRVIEDLKKKVRVKLAARIFILEKVLFHDGLFGLLYQSISLKEKYTDVVEVSRDCIEIRR